MMYNYISINNPNIKNTPILQGKYNFEVFVPDKMENIPEAV